jgi:hypothetical protein
MSQNNTFKKGTKVKYVYRENGVKVIEERLDKLEEMHPPVEWQEKIADLKHKVYVLIMKVKEMEERIDGLCGNCKNMPRDINK